MTDACASYYDEDGCLVTPECPAVEEVPAHMDLSPIVGWTAGANSNARVDGDASLRFLMPAGVVGAMIGFRHDPGQQTRPSLIEHGFYFQRAGADYVQVIELGVTKTTLRPRHTGDLFEVRRVGGVVTYWQNGSLVYQSAQPSVGRILVNTCLYTSGDSVPARFDPDAPPPGAPGTNPLTVDYADVAFIVMENPDSGFAAPAGGSYQYLGEGSTALIDPSWNGMIQGSYDASCDFDGHVHFDIDAASAPIDAVLFALFPFGTANSVSITSYSTSGTVFATSAHQFLEGSDTGTIDGWPWVGGAPGGITSGSPYLEKTLDASENPYATFTKAEMIAAGFTDEYLASISAIALVGAAVRISNGGTGLDVVFTTT